MRENLSNDFTKEMYTSFTRSFIIPTNNNTGQKHAALLFNGHFHLHGTGRF